MFLIVVWFAGMSIEKKRHSGVMQTQLRGKVDELDRQLSQFAVVPRLLSRNPVIIQGLKTPDAFAISSANQTLHRAQLDSNAAFAFLMNVEGTTLASSNFSEEVSFVGINYGFRPYFLQAMEKAEATFFAVGATTGVPGYFVASPVLEGDSVIGVVVVKFDLDHLLRSWDLHPYHWLAVDEFGVVILSTNDNYLYVRTRELAANEVSQITDDRRYELAIERFSVDGNSGRFSSDAGKESYYVQQYPSSVEDWSLKLVVANTYLASRVLVYLLIVLSLLAVVALLRRNIQSRKNLADAEKQYARRLELEVQQRTDELRSAQQALIIESNYAMLGRMSGAINHEVNQPLASLRLNLATLRQLIDSPSSDMEEIRQVVIDSDRTTKRIGRVITTLRNLTSQKHAEHDEVKMLQVITEVRETIERERPGMFQSLSLSVANPLPVVIGSDVLLQQAILNLLYNAFDAVADVEEPEVELKAAAVDTGVMVEVVDNGCGVSDSVAESLFKPFVTDKTRSSGLGLGLTLVEMIAKDHGGLLQYKPVPDGASKGSIFVLTLPTQRYANG